jgi:hypothetical protein
MRWVGFCRIRVVAAFGVSACTTIAGCATIVGLKDVPDVSRPAGDGEVIDVSPHPGDGELVPQASWCSEQGGAALFCDDFDGDAGLMPRWMASATDGSAFPTLDDSSFVSPPASLVVAVPPSSGTLQSFVTAQVPGVAPTLRLELDLSFDGLSSYLTPVELELTVAGETTTLQLILTPGGATIVHESFAPDGGIAQEQSGLSGFLAQGVWTRLALTLATSPSALSVTESDPDGGHEFPLLTSWSLSPPVPSAPLILSLGAIDRQPSAGATTVHVDNVRVIAVDGGM